MKLPSDKITIEHVRDHSKSPDAKSTAQGQREFRQRQKFNFLISVTRNENSKWINQ